MQSSSNAFAAIRADGRASRRFGHRGVARCVCHESCYDIDDIHIYAYVYIYLETN